MTSSVQHPNLAWHFDFHSHHVVNIGTAPDPQGVAAALADTQVTEIITFAKGHCGYTYYPTDVPTCYRHPKMHGDPFGDIVKACTARGIRVLAYISFGIDGEGARHHPDWLMQSFAKTPPTLSPDWFNNVCPFTAYTDICVLPQVDEICRRYPIKGFFFDTMGALTPCYCPVCTKSFLEQTGKPIPTEAESPEWPAFGKFRHDRGLALLDRVSAFIQERIPGAAVGFNQVGTIPFPDAMPKGCTRLTLDYQTSGPQSRTASRCAAYGSMCDAPADVMPTIFNSGWGDWSPAPKERHEQIAAAVWARKCTLYMGDRMHPENRLAEPSKQALLDLKDIRTRIAAEYPAADSTLAPDILVLHSIRMQYGPDLRYFAIDPRGRHRPLDGMCDLLIDAGANYAIAPEHTLARHLDGVSLVVLPELESIDAATEQTLRDFTGRGGQVLIIGNLPKVNGQPLNWLGVTADETTPWQNHMYLPALEKNGGHPTLVRGTCYAVSAAPDAKIISHAIAPLDMKFGVRFGWGISPPSNVPSTNVGLSFRRIGDQGGAAWVLPVPLASSYQEQGNWQQVHYLAALLEKILPAPKARLEHEAPDVEIVLHEAPAASWAFLINHGGETMWGVNGKYQWTRTWGSLPARRVTVNLRAASDRKPKAATVAGKPVPFRWSQKQQRVRVTMKLDQIWSVIRVDWE